MRLTFTSSLAAAALAVSVPALADQVDLPRPSPTAKMMQSAGVTEITVDYSSPGVKGRLIWGTVVPFGEVWRAGANATTKVTFSKDVSVGNTPVAAGSYAFFVIPNKTGPWTLILNKDFNQGGAFNYKKELDVARVDATPAAIPNRERLAYIVSDETNDFASLDLEWEKVRLSLPVKLNTDAQVAANIAAIKPSDSESFATAANYERTVKNDNDAALALADKALAESWRGYFEKAQALSAKGDNKQAYSVMQKADKLAKDAKAPDFFQAQIAKALKEWKH